MQVYPLQRYHETRDLPTDARLLQVKSAYTCSLYTMCTTFVESKMQPLCDQYLSTALQRLPICDLSVKHSASQQHCVVLQAKLLHMPEVFGFDRFQTASFLAQGTYLQTHWQRLVPGEHQEVSSHSALDRTVVWLQSAIFPPLSSKEPPRTSFGWHWQA